MYYGFQPSMVLHSTSNDIEIMFRYRIVTNTLDTISSNRKMKFKLRI